MELLIKAGESTYSGFIFGKIEVWDVSSPTRKFIIDNNK